jgi:copper transport protein
MRDEVFASVKGMPTSHARPGWLAPAGATTAPRRRGSLSLVGLVAGLIAAMAAALPASAHALLVKSIPEANASLPTAPAQVEIYFSESVEPSFSTIRVLDSNGSAVDNGDVRLDPADDTHLSVSLRSLPDGVYTVTWRALSLSDGHVTTGSFPFAVGNVDEAALAAAQSSQSASLSLGEAVSKWLLYLAAAALIGGLLFRLAVWDPAQRAAGVSWGDPSPPDVPITTSSLFMLLAVSLFSLLLEAGQASGVGIAVPWSSSLSTMLFTTRSGAIWLTRLLVMVAMVALVGKSPTTLRRWSSVGLGVIFLLTISLGSHAASDSQPLLPVSADLLHLTAACAWLGGLMSFVSGMWRARQSEAGARTRLTSELIPRFSSLALTSVGCLTLSGLYSAFLRVGTLTALTQTLYGRILIAKCLIVLAMITLGAVNLLIITPAMRRAAGLARGDPGLVDRFQRIITSEVTLGTALFLSVGLLTSAPPARVTTESSGLHAKAQADDLSIDLEITPGRVGVNTFTATIKADGKPLEQAKEVSLQFTPTQASMPPSKVSLAAQGNGVYSVKGAFLSLPSEWQVQVAVRRPDKFDAFANFNFAVGTSSATTAFPWSRVTGGLLAAAAVVYVFATHRVSRTARQFVLLGTAPAIVLLVAGASVFLRPATTSSGELANPIPPNPVSVAAGKVVYTANCVPCHGVSGKGDGPIGITLNPRPADLTIHAVPGVHSDGQLYEWITNGFPGSVMPAFKKVLSDDDRWNLVNFIRTFAPK